MGQGAAHASEQLMRGPEENASDWSWLRARPIRSALFILVALTHASLEYGFAALRTVRKALTED